MDSLVSIHCQDQALNKYLDGTFSDQWRAIPTESLNVSSRKDYFTFRLIPMERIERPNFLVFTWRTLRFEGLSLSLGGLLAALVLMWVSHRPINFELAWFCFLPIALFHIGMNLLNDYYDHTKGVNRIGSIKPIQAGWVRAVDLFYWGWAFMTLGAVFGLAILFMTPQPIFILSLIAGLGILEFSSNRLGLKYSGYGEITLFLLTGPLLVLGYVFVVSGHVTTSEIMLSLFLGLLTLTVMHVNNMREILVSSQAGVLNLATRFGFDRAKKIFTFLLISLAITWWALILNVTGNAWAYGPWLLGLFVLKMTWFRVVQSKSPMSSLMRKAVDLRFAWHQLMIILFLSSLFLI